MVCSPCTMTLPVCSASQNRSREGQFNLAVRDQPPQSATRSPRCSSTPKPIILLNLLSVLSSTPVAVRRISSSCPPDPLLCHGLNLNDNTFQFRVIFRSCSFAIIFASLLFISPFFEAPQQHRRRASCPQFKVDCHPVAP